MTLVVGVFLVGCGGPRQGNGDREGRPLRNSRIRAEAYLFDARIKHDGRTTSVRLDLYRTDTLIGFAGRGYLGKGAFKGWIAAESLLVFMPRTNEFMQEAIAELRVLDSSVSCLDELDLLRLFGNLPDQGNLGHLLVESNYDNLKRPEFEISDPGGLWQLDLVYDEHDPGWRIREFEFDDGSDFQLEATRRRFKTEARIPVDAFSVELPPDARRIIP